MKGLFSLFVALVIAGSLSSQDQFFTSTVVPKKINVSTGTTLEYVEQGRPTGVPIIFLHGITDSWHSFELVLPFLPESVHAFAISLRGHGGSSKPATGYMMKDLSEDVYAFMKKKKIPKAVIVGHSMGSIVAEQFITDHPDMVSKLVLVGAFPYAVEDKDLKNFYDGLMQRKTPIDSTFAAEFQASTITKKIPDWYFNRVVAESMKAPLYVWQQALHGVTQTDFRNALPLIKVPTLILWGDKDTYTLRPAQDLLVSLIPGSELKVYNDTGHALHWEEPEQFADDLLEFVGENY
jgi:pimeloyl-ACP methyl ester carboxylesterase